MKQSKIDKLTSEIVAFLKEKGSYDVRVVWKHEYSHDGSCRITVHKSGGIGSLISFANLKWISDKLGTEEIYIENEYHQDGCESCDHGSYDEADIVCLNIKPF